MAGFKAGVAGALALALSGCAATENFLSHNSTTPQFGPQNESLFKTDRPANASETMVKLPTQASELDCPEVDVSEGGATARVGGAAGQDTRYQFNIGDVARECDPQGAQFALKVGVSGELLIGPAGSPGAYSTALHVMVKRAADNKVLFEKSYSVSANSAGGDQASFRMVTEPILLPLTRARLNEDYSITVGFNAGGSATTRVRRTRRQG